MNADPLADLSSLRLHPVIRERARGDEQPGRALVLTGHAIAEPREPETAEKLVIGPPGDDAVPIALVKPLAQLDRKQPFTLLAEGREGCVAESGARVAVALAMEGSRGSDRDRAGTPWTEAYMLDPTPCPGDPALLGAHPRVRRATSADRLVVFAAQLDSMGSGGRLPAAEIGFLRSHPDRALEVFGSDASGSRIFVEHQLAGTWHPNGHVRVRCGDELERTFENAAFSNVFVVGDDGRLYVGVADRARGGEAASTLLRIR